MTEETFEDLSRRMAALAHELGVLRQQAQELAMDTATSVDRLQPAADGGPGFLVIALTVLALACFVGYYVVWNVTPALHSPLMGVTNAISSVIIVGAIIAAGPADFSFAQFMGFLAVILASVNIFGGFMITHRMLSMFKRKERPAAAAKAE